MTAMLTADTATEVIWQAESRYAEVVVRRDGDQWTVTGHRRAEPTRVYRAWAPVCHCEHEELDRSLAPPRKVARPRPACRHGVGVPSHAGLHGLTMRGRCPDADKNTNSAWQHKRTHCHGDAGPRHLEHMVQLAEHVLASYKTAHLSNRKPRKVA